MALLSAALALRAWPAHGDAWAAGLSRGVARGHHKPFGNAVGTREPVPLWPAPRARPSRVRLRAFSGDPWKVLGVEPGASPVEIKRAYRRRALKEHPDVNKSPDAKERWQELSQAYDVLSDPEKMKVWRMAQARAGAGGGARGRQRSAWGAGGMPKGPREKELDDKYDTGGDSLGSIFGDFLEGLGGEVGGAGGGIGKARKAGAFVLEELLDFLEGGGRSMGDDLSRPAEELKAARDELSSLQSLDTSLRNESDVWAQKAEVAKTAGKAEEEMTAMQKVFDARERRKNVRRRALRAEERVEYLEKVVFEAEKKTTQRREKRGQAAQVDLPGMYTIEHDGTKVAPSEELSTTFVAELNKGANVKVVEVVRREKDKRVRGRLESPAGWISLLNTESGYRWAMRDEKADAGFGGFGGAAGSWPPPRPPKPDFDADAALEDLKSKRR